MARFLRGALLFVFAAAAILPFCTSFFLCTMPCCHDVASPDTAMKAPMPPCPGSPAEGCATEMSAAVEHTTSTAAAPTPTASKLAVTRIATFAPQVPAIEMPAQAPLPAAPAALHVLNSVFRI